MGFLIYFVFFVFFGKKELHEKIYSNSILFIFGEKFKSSGAREKFSL